ncbi:MAG: alginate lyase family protein [Bryobacteraceae bacterium]|nr:alginate lyase family protein [Bryobacteraceae bacterium]
MKRRVFLTTLAAGRGRAAAKIDVAALDRGRVLAEAQRFLARPPVTPVASRSPRSAGGPHDFFSEGDYWWPDPKNPGGPYLRRDGLTNPANFVDHRNYLMRLSVEAPALAAAWKLTRDQRYARHAAAHLRAWFVAPATRMNPNLQYAQAIQGRSTGRGTGIIDTIHLVEVARAIPVIAQAGALSKGELAEVQQWFAAYTEWMATSPNGIEERDAKNNHGTCWTMQVAAFAELTGDRQRIAACAERFRTLIVPEQIAPDGSQPLEVSRTKPYGYCLFNLEALTTLCQIGARNGHDLWSFQTKDGRGVRQAVEYLFPFIADKQQWKHPPDVMYFDEWPMRQAALFFGGLAYGRQDYLDVWRKLPASSQVDEVVRNFFIRQPVLWT